MWDRFSHNSKAQLDDVDRSMAAGNSRHGVVGCASLFEASVGFVGFVGSFSFKRLLRLLCLAVP